MQQGKSYGQSTSCGSRIGGGGHLKRLSSQEQRNAQSRVSDMWSRNDDVGIV